MPLLQQMDDFIWTIEVQMEPLRLPYLYLPLPSVGLVLAVRFGFEINWSPREHLVLDGSEEEVRVQVHLKESGICFWSHGASQHNMLFLGAFQLQ